MAAGAAALAALAGVLGACGGGTTTAASAGNTGQDAVSAWCKNYEPVVNSVDRYVAVAKSPPSSATDSDVESWMGQLAPQAATLAQNPPPVPGVSSDWTAGYSLLSKGAAAFSHGDISTGTSDFQQAGSHLQAVVNNAALQNGDLCGLGITP